MKRFLAASILALILPAMAGAAIPDISNLSRDELIELDQQIHLRLFDEQLIEGVRVPQGTYIIGEDIPAGTYRIEITDGTGCYDVYDNPDGKLIHSGITGKSYNVTEIGKITFDDGNILELVNSTFIFYPYTGIFH